MLAYRLDFLGLLSMKNARCFMFLFSLVRSSSKRNNWRLDIPHLCLGRIFRIQYKFKRINMQPQLLTKRSMDTRQNRVHNELEIDMNYDIKQSTCFSELIYIYEEQHTVYNLCSTSVFIQNFKQHTFHLTFLRNLRSFRQHKFSQKFIK